jgi:hypothetical protein
VHAGIGSPGRIHDDSGSGELLQHGLDLALHRPASCLALPSHEVTAIELQDREECSAHGAESSAVHRRIQVAQIIGDAEISCGFAAGLSGLAKEKTVDRGGQLVEGRRLHEETSNSCFLNGGFGNFFHEAGEHDDRDVRAKRVDFAGDINPVILGIV